MEDDTQELDLSELDQIEASSENKLKVKNRFQTLSDKVKTTSQERDLETEARKKVETEKSRIEKERDFYKDFSQVSSKYPNASAYQDKILEKVNAGYTTEDATLVVLGREGKLQSITADTQPMRPDNIAGGSAVTSVSEGMDKNPNEMTRDELRKALLDQEKQGINLLKP